MFPFNACQNVPNAITIYNNVIPISNTNLITKNNISSDNWLKLTHNLTFQNVFQEVNLRDIFQR